MVYELNDGNPHDHIVCNACGGVHEFFDAEIEARQQAVAEQIEFAVLGRRLVLFGLCVNCKKGQRIGQADDPEIAVRFAFMWLPSSQQN